MKLISFHHVSWDIRRARREAGYSFLGGSTSRTSVAGTTNSSAPLHTDIRGPATKDEGAVTPATEGGHVMEDTDAMLSWHLSGLVQGERGSPATPAEWAVLRYSGTICIT
jgi:hypothetical protein